MPDRCVIKVTCGPSATVPARCAEFTTEKAARLISPTIPRPGQFLTDLVDVNGDLMAASNLGLYVLTPDGWKPMALGIDSAHIGVAHGCARRGIFYAAKR